VSTHPAEYLYPPVAYGSSTDVAPWAVLGASAAAQTGRRRRWGGRRVAVRAGGGCCAWTPHAAAAAARCVSPCPLADRRPAGGRTHLSAWPFPCGRVHTQAGREIVPQLEPVVPLSPNRRLRAALSQRGRGHAGHAVVAAAGGQRQRGGARGGRGVAAGVRGAARVAADDDAAHGAGAHAARAPAAGAAPNRRATCWLTHKQHCCSAHPRSPVGHPQAARLDQLLMRANTFQQQHAPVARSDSTPIVALDQLGPADCLNRGAAR
jgi:hypothetical protein